MMCLLFLFNLQVINPTMKINQRKAIVWKVRFGLKLVNEKRHYEEQNLFHYFIDLINIRSYLLYMTR